MKKIMLKIASFVLSFTLVTACIAAAPSAAPVKAQADDGESAFVSVIKSIAYDGLEKILTGVLSGISSIIPDRTDAVDPDEYKSENFYKGTDEFLDAPAANAKWELGYSYASLVPDDWQEYTYYLGGYMTADNQFTNNVEGVIDDMGVRIIAISDGSGRGVSLFGTIDAIGVSNKDIRAIRSMLAETAQENGIKLCSVNVGSTHSHSGIDTQGLWTQTAKKAIRNIFSAFTGLIEMEPGADEHYLEFMRKTVADAMLTACKNMVSGTMTFASKDIGSDYFHNKNRSSASSMPTDLNRFIFTPDEKYLDTYQPTMIVNMGAHPDVAGLATDDGQSSGREVCGEYIYYIGDEIGKYGYNCMFFNGAIAGIYISRGASNDGVTMDKRYQQSERYGREIGRMLLAMNLTEDEIYRSEFYDADVVAAEIADTEANGGTYSLWCEDWMPVTSSTVAPIFNIRLKEVRIDVTNPLILLAGKLKLANYDIIRDSKGNYSVYTEIGYLEFGNIGVAMVPGELVSDIYAGGTSLTADGSCLGIDFPYPSLKALFGEDILCFGLSNDAIGYIVPDNDYKMIIVDDHYQELISLGSTTASTIMAAFVELADEVK